MIYCPCYTSERINSLPSLVVSPIKLFKEVVKGSPNPVVYDGCFFGKSEGYKLVCYNEANGDALWVGETKELITGSPLKVDGKLFLIDGDSDVVAVSFNEGKFLSNFGSSSVTQWASKGEDLFISIFEEDNEFKKKIHCRDSEKFQVKWVYKGLQFDYFAVSDGYVLLKDNRGNLANLDIMGQERWRLSPLDTGLFTSQEEVDSLPESKPGFSNLNQTIGYPMIYQNRIGITPMLDNHLIGVDLATGKVLWSRKVENSQNWIRQGYCDEVYCLGSYYIEAFSLETGKQTKKVAIDGSYITESLGVETISFTQFAVSETHIFAASSIMQYFAAISIETGKVDWTFNPDEAITATDQPYVANGRVYYPCLGKMYIFEGKEGYVQAL